MRKLLTLMLLLCAISPITVFAQNVDVSGAVVGNGSFPTLGAAFNAINSGVQTGAVIQVSVTGNTTETVAATLNQGVWTSLTISPSGGSAKTISGSLAGGLIQLDGADRVVFDGINIGSRTLILNNAFNGSASTVYLFNDARNVQFVNCTIRGCNTDVNSGTIRLGTSAGGGGNDHISITNSLIEASGANFPVNAIFSAGTAGQENSQVSISNCMIADYYSTGSASAGIAALSNNSDWTVSNCLFYQTASRNYTTANTHRAIWVNGGNNHLISGNLIGYATALSTGIYTMTSAVATRFIAIDISGGTTTPSSVQGNTVTAISLTSSSGAYTTYGVLCGISIGGGNVNVGDVMPNTIGGTSGTGHINMVSATSNGSIVGIHNGSTGNAAIRNNIIGGLVSPGSSAIVGGGIVGISNSAAAASLTISGNTIGNSTADNMRGGVNGVTTGSTNVAGIHLSTLPAGGTISNNTIQNLSSYGIGTGGNAYVRGVMTPAGSGFTNTLQITGNTIRYLTTNSANPSIANGNACAVGIQVGAGSNNVIQDNIIHNISNINSAALSNFVAGITSGNATNNNIIGNKIYGLSNASTGTTATSPPIVAGVIIRSGTTAVMFITI